MGILSFSRIKFHHIFFIFFVLASRGLLPTHLLFANALKDGAAVRYGTIFPTEELVYEVSFMSVKLGTIKIITLADTVYETHKVHHAKVLIQSNPNIPFYSLRAIFNSLMDTSLMTGRYFEANTKEKSDLWGFQKITFNKTNIINRKWYNNEKINDTAYENTGAIVDGSSLFFYARKHSGQNKSVKLPTIMDLSIGDTKIKFTDKIEKIKISAVEYPIKTFFLEGVCDWKALYGLGGKFNGWFSADVAAVPIKATMNVYLGKVTIELKSWKRADWSPPKF